MPKDAAIIADIDGEVVFGGLHRGLRKVSVVAGAESFDYFIPRGKQFNVINGDHVSAGDQLTSGSPVLHDILRILGPDVVQRYLLIKFKKFIVCKVLILMIDILNLLFVKCYVKFVWLIQVIRDFLIGDRVDRIHFKTVMH